jgi:hypothetical protein
MNIFEEVQWGDDHQHTHQEKLHEIIWFYPTREWVYMNIFEEVQWGDGQGGRIA